MTIFCSVIAAACTAYLVGTNTKYDNVTIFFLAFIAFCSTYFLIDDIRNSFNWLKVRRRRKRISKTHID